MNLITLSWKNLRSKWLNSTLSLVLFALGVGLISLLMLMSRQMSERLYGNMQGVNLVVGAKGSKLQLVLCGVYHIDRPTGNISMEDGQALARIKGLTERVVPEALGDSYEMFRIVGTTPDYPALYKAQIAEGNWWQHDLETTIGADVAERAKLKIGDTFSGSHGLAEGGASHEGHAYKVVGIMARTGTVMDQLILTNISSVWRVHDHAEEEPELDGPAEAHLDTADHEGHEHEAGHEHEHEAEMPEVHSFQDFMTVDPAGKEITTLLIQYKLDADGNPSTMADLQIPKIIDENFKEVGYAQPIRETTFLMENIGLGLDFLKWLAVLFIVVSALSVFISLYNSLKERRYEIALTRVMGASPMKVFWMVVLEGLLLSFVGFVLGIVLSHAGMAVLSSAMEESWRYRFNGFFFFLKEEGYVLLGALAVGFAASILPAIQAYRTDISKTLSRA